MKHKLLPLSETMHYILLALREPFHGYAIMHKVEEMSKGHVILAAGTLYGAIDNLSKNGWIKPAAGENGRRKVYQITAQGEEVLAHEKQRLKHILSLYEMSDECEKI